MKLYIEANNPKYLSVLAIIEEYNIKNIDYDLNADKSKLLFNNVPVLEIEGELIFNTSSICNYLLSLAGQCNGNEKDLDKWASFNETLVLPSVYSCFASQKPSNEALISVLQTLNESLSSSKFLIGDVVSASDFTTWSSVFPVLRCSDKSSAIMASFEPVNRWFQAMDQRPSCAKVTKSVDVKLVKSVMQSRPLQQSGLPNTASTTTTASSTSASSTAKNSGDRAGKVTVKKELESPSESQNLSAAPVSKEELEESLTAWTKSSVELKTKKQHPILPQADQKNYMITSALPYVNNVPHLGNIIGCVLSADVFARYCRSQDYNTLYICGTDEYGTATETKAAQENLTPQQICDKYHALHSDIYKWFNIDFDKFGRTTTVHQKEIAQSLFWDLHKAGFICKDSVDQLLCQNCDRYLADRFVEGTCPLCGYDDARGDQCDACGKLLNSCDLLNPRCKQCSQTPVVRNSNHLFLDLPKLEGRLVEHIDKVFEEGIWTNNAQKITRTWIRDGLKPRCISRDLKWGIPVPLEGYTDKVFYVWYDAPIGYISITASYTDQWKQWWQNPKQVQLYNFMAKDNVPFHSVIFPSTLLGSGPHWTVVNHMSSTEYLNYEDAKFSKSRGLGVFGDQAASTEIPSDVWRFYLLYIRPESQDSSFSWLDLATKNNSELLNNLGNFINRALVFISNNFNGLIGEILLDDPAKELIARVNRELKCYHNHLSNTRLRDGLRNVLSISRLGNQYMQSTKPWVLFKGTEQQKREGHSVTSLCANVSALISLTLQPYMPTTGATIARQLKLTTDDLVLPQLFVPILKAGHTINKPEPLFSKIESSTVEELKKKFAGKEEVKSKTEIKISKDPKELEKQISDQGNKVRDLKASKADKDAIKQEVAVLLKLKKSLENLKIVDSKPSEVSEESLTNQIAVQGDKVRQLKASKADKMLIKQQVEVLLSLKKSLENHQKSSSSQSHASEDALNQQITAQGNKVRELRAKNEDKATIKREVDILLKLKAELSKVVG